MKGQWWFRAATTSLGAGAAADAGVKEGAAVFALGEAGVQQVVVERRAEQSGHQTRTQ